MKKFFLIPASILLIAGCADKPMATNVVQLAGDQKVLGWQDKNETQKPKVIIKKVYIKEKIKDTDGDGVPDNIDKCPNTPKNTAVNHYGCPVITTLRINFDFNKAEVKKIYYPEIKKVAEVLKSNPALKIEIDGYTDNIGSKEYNLKLSKKRAEAIKNVLVKIYHINPKRIITKGYGEKYPLVPNTTSTNRALNRRAEIIDITNKK